MLLTTVLLAPLPRSSTHLLRTVTGAAMLIAVPHGGQRTARRNAWAGTSDGAARARGRREARDAVELAARRVEAVGT